MSWYASVSDCTGSKPTWKQEKVGKEKRGGGRPAEMLVVATEVPRSSVVREIGEGETRREGKVVGRLLNVGNPSHGAVGSKQGHQSSLFSGFLNSVKSMDLSASLSQIF